MDPELAKLKKWSNRFWNVMSWIAVALGIITAAITAFALRTGDQAASAFGLFLVVGAIVTIVQLRFWARDDKELSKQSQPTK